jgi:hypothetical protein
VADDPFQLQPFEITLGGIRYPIQSLKLGQLRDLSIGVVMPPETDIRVMVRRKFERDVQLIEVALRYYERKLSADDLFSMPISRQEMDEAADKILTCSGLVPPRKSLEALKEQVAELQKEIAEREAAEVAADPTGKGEGGKTPA